MRRPTYVIFAGVNGAGKSTFYHTGFWENSDIPKNMTRVNADEILVRNKGDQNSEKDQFAAGKKAVRHIEKCLAKGKSFNQETTLSGHACMKTIQKSKSRQLSNRHVLHRFSLSRSSH